MTTPVQPTTSNTHVSSNFAKLLEPGLRKIFFQTYAEVPEQFSKFYNVLNSKKAKEYDHTMGAFGDWTERASELSEVSYGKISDGYDITYTHSAFTKGFMVSRELYDDEQYRQINKFPAAMARAGRAFVEKKASETFLHAFGEGACTATVNSGTLEAPVYNYTYSGFDSVPLISDMHVLKDSSTVIGKNLFTGALTDANLKLALKKMRETVDEAGNIIGIHPTRLIVPPALEFTAKAIVNSAQQSGTANNDINTIKGALEVCVYDYIGAAAGGSDTVWFLQDPSLSELNFFWRVKPEFKAENDFDTFVAKYRGYMRFSYGYSDWRGIGGSVGA